MGLSLKTKLEKCGKQRLGYIVLCFLVYLSVYKGGISYAAAVVLQYGVDRFRLPAGGLYDCFIGEKSAIPHTPFPPFPLVAAAGLFGYDSPLCCGCARTVCRFHAAALSGKRTGKPFPVSLCPAVTELPQVRRY